MSTIDILIAARARVARGWTQDALARDAQGREIPNPRRTDVACMCAVGAVLASDETPEEEGGTITASMNALLASIEDGASTRRAFTSAARLVASWNDAPERTQADVLAAFDRAIAAMEAEE